VANIKQEKAYKLYIQNIPLTQIATTVGVSRQTISNWRKKYDWDTEALLDATSTAEMKAKEQQFVAQLIRQFESATDELESSDSPKKLEILQRYTQAYYKLKSAEGDCRFAKEKLTKEVAYATIEEMAKIALRHHASDVAEFMSTHADEIVTLVRSR